MTTTVTASLPQGSAPSSARTCRRCRTARGLEDFPLWRAPHAAGWATRMWCGPCLVTAGHLRAGAVERARDEYLAAAERRAEQARLAEAAKTARAAAAADAHAAQIAATGGAGTDELDEATWRAVHLHLAHRDALVASLLDRAHRDADFAAALDRAARWRGNDTLDT